MLTLKHVISLLRPENIIWTPSPISIDTTNSSPYSPLSRITTHPRMRSSFILILMIILLYLGLYWLVFLCFCFFKPWFMALYKYYICIGLALSYCYTKLPHIEYCFASCLLSWYRPYLRKTSFPWIFFCILSIFWRFSNLVWIELLCNYVHHS